jgi:cytochrome c oxidase cbb3-type subunit III
MSVEPQEPEDGVGTTGHEWDGIKEYNNPLPRWWLYVFYATVIWAIGYTIVYPAWPGIAEATRGTLGWSSRGEVAAEMLRVSQARAATIGRIEAMPIEQLRQDSKLMRVAVEGGRSAYKVYCVQCHGSGAAGAKGYPNLNDDDWLWGGDIGAVEATLRHGIRSPDDEATRTSMMPAFGRDGMLTAAQIGDVVEHVRRLSHQPFEAAGAKRGAAVFAEQCAVCHAADGTGNRAVGAPNLTDPIWLYGGDRETLARTVHGPRGGVMPAWEKKLDPATIKQLAAYVHSLGGGE